MKYSKASLKKVVEKWEMENIDHEIAGAVYDRAIKEAEELKEDSRRNQLVSMKGEELRRQKMNIMALEEAKKKLTEAK